MVLPQTEKTRRYWCAVLRVSCLFSSFFSHVCVHQCVGEMWTKIIEENKDLWLRVSAFSSSIVLSCVFEAPRLQFCQPPASVRPSGQLGRSTYLCTSVTIRTTISSNANHLNQPIAYANAASCRRLAKKNGCGYFLVFNFAATTCLWRKFYMDHGLHEFDWLTEYERVPIRQWMWPI